MSRLKAKQTSSFVNGRDVFVLTDRVWEVTLLPLVFDYLQGQKKASIVFMMCVSPIVT